MIDQYKPMQIDWAKVEEIKENSVSILSNITEETTTRHSLSRPRSNTLLPLYRVIANTLFDFNLKTITDYIYLEKDFYNNIDEIYTIKAYAAAVVGYGENKVFGLDFQNPNKIYSDYKNLKEWDFDCYLAHKKSIDCKPSEAWLDEEYILYMLDSPIQYIDGDNYYDAILSSTHRHIAHEATSIKDEVFTELFPEEVMPKFDIDLIDLPNYLNLRQKNPIYNNFNKITYEYERELQRAIKISESSKEPKIYMHLYSEIANGFGVINILANNSSALESINLNTFCKDLEPLIYPYSEIEKAISLESTKYKQFIIENIDRIKKTT